MSRSTFPAQIDTFTTKVDITSADVANVNRYRELKSKPNLTASEQAELSNLTVTLATKLMSPEDFNKLQDCIVALENFTKDNVDGYIQQKQAEFDATLGQFTNKGSYSNLTTYDKWNTVLYNFETYMSLQDNNLNHTPIGDGTDAWWQKLSLRGKQGAPGIGLSFVGEYNNSYSYSVGNAVNYNNSIYYCINASTGNLPTNTDYWQIFISNSGVSVTAEEPSSPFENMVWIDTSTTYNNIKYWNGLSWNTVGTSASKVSISDASGLIAATNVEDALQELATKDNALTTNISNIQKYFPASGTATAITVTTGFFNLVNGQSFTFIASANNNGAPTTINADAKGARNLYKPNTTTTPRLIAGKAYTVWYDTTSSCFFLKASAEGNAIAANVLAGKTFSNDDDTGLSGTMPNNGSQTATLSITGSTKPTRTIPAGYTTGGIVTAQVAPSKAGDIRAGVTLGGTAGTFTGNATALASHILNGYTAGINGVMTTGTMPNQGAKIITPGTTNKAIPSGYHNGSGYVQGSVNLKPENIKNGVNVFGVIGNLISITPNAGTIPLYSKTGVVFSDSNHEVPTYKGYIEFSHAGTYEVRYTTYGLDTSSDEGHKNAVPVSQLYLNGSPLTEIRENSSYSNQTWTSVHTVSAGDRIEFYLGKKLHYGEAYVVYIKNVQVLIDRTYPTVTLGQ